MSHRRMSVPQSGRSLRARILAAIACVAGGSFTAHAQVTRMVVETSTDGTNWSNATRNVLPGASLQVRYVVSFDAAGTTSTPVGLANLYFQPTFSNWLNGQDTLASFATSGNNINGGAVADSSGLFGRMIPFGASGPTTSDPYRGITQTASGTNYLRIARTTITNWIGTGPTTGTSAANNFNGAGGLFCVQKGFSSITGSDPQPNDSITNVIVAKFGITLASVVQNRTMTLDVPINGLSRNSTTGNREAAWFASPTELLPSIKAAVAVSPATINVSTADCAIITLQPTSSSVCSGRDGLMKVVATGQNLSFQWRRNSVPITGATAAILNFSPAQASDSGTYDCIVTGVCGSVTSSAATLTVTTAPAVTTQPTSVSVCENGSTSLSVGISGSPTPTVTWRRNGVPISGASGTTLFINAVNASTVGTYDCLLSNTCGSTTSNAVSVATNGNSSPSITTQPQPTTACAGTTATLSLTSGGTPPFTYQWRKNSSNISGATSATFTRTVTAADAGNYDCVVSNACGSITSQAAALTISTPVQITTSPSNVSIGTNQTATFYASASGTGTLIYKWLRNGQPLTDNARITGSDTPTLTISSSQSSDQGLYACRVSNTCNTVTTTQAILNLYYCNPTWISRPDMPFGKRWVHAQAHDAVSGGTLLFGGRNVNGVSLGDTWLLKDSDWTRVSTTGPAARSDHAMVSMGAAGVLLFGGKTDLTDGSCQGDTWKWDGTSWTRVATSGPSPRGGHCMAYDAARQRVVLFGGFDADSQLLSDTWEWDGTSWRQVMAAGPDGRFASAIAYDPIAGTTLLFGGYGNGTKGDTWTWNGSAWTLVALSGPPARYYASAVFNGNSGLITLFGGADATLMNDQWTWNGAAWASGSFSNTTITPRWAQAASYDATTQRIVVSGGSNAINELFSDSYEASDRPVILRQPQDNLMACGSAYLDLNYTIPYPGASFAWYVNGSYYSSSSAIYVSTNADVYCVLSNYCGSTVSRTARVVVYNAPTFTEQPVSDSICEGRTATLRVGTASSDLPTSYQWYKYYSYYGWRPMDGATSSTLTIPNFAQADEGAYRCIASNFCNYRESNTVSLGFNATTRATISTTSLVFCEGRSSSLSVYGLTGTDVAFQWRRDGQALPGFTSSSIGLSQLSDSGIYDCVVSGRCNTITTDPCTVRVKANARITRQPVTQNLCPNTPTTISLEASGEPPLTYYWYHNDRYVSSASGPQLPVGETEDGSYYCYVENGCSGSRSQIVYVNRFSQPTLSYSSPRWNYYPSVGGTAQLYNIVSSSGAPDGVYSLRWYRNGVPLSDDGRITGTSTNTLTIQNFSRLDVAAYSLEVRNQCLATMSQPGWLFMSGCSYSWFSRGPMPFAERWVHAQAFDAITTSTLLFGGRDRAGRTLGDTWRLTDGQWQQLTVAGPSARSDHAMVSMGSAGILLFGGKTTPNDSTCQGDTWLWNGSAWSRVATTGPAPRGGHSMAYDSARNRVVLFGGFGTNSAVLSDTWEWDGTAWTQVSTAGPAGRFAASMAYDPVFKRTMLFGGYNAGIRSDTWVWDGTTWTYLTDGSSSGVGARYYASAAFDESLGSVVIVGGVGPSGIINSEFAWYSGNWNNFTFNNPPTARWTHAMSYDPSVRRMVVTGGAGVALTRFNDLWELTDQPAILSQPQNAYACAGGGSASFTVVAAGWSSLTYQWRHDGVPISNANSPVFSLPSIASTDMGSYDCVISNGCGSITSAAATLSVSIPPVFSLAPRSVAICPGTSTTFTAAASGAPTPTYQWRRNGVNIPGAVGATYTVASASQADVGTYDCIASNPCQNVTSTSATLTLNVPASVAINPVSTETCPGSGANFRAIGAGQPAPTLQWRKNGVDLPGETGEYLRITAATLADAASYDCVVTNTCNAAVSLPATLTVTTPVSIAAGPVSQTHCAGETNEFTVSASGSAPISYQWRRNGQAITSATAATYAFTSTQASAGSYDCIVSNRCGSLTSSAATLTVDDVPAIVSNPVAAAVCPGEPISFSVAATGAAPITYQWRRNGAVIAGATSPTLQIAAVASGDAGAYDCITTNHCGSTTSSQAVLSLNSVATIVTSPSSQSICPGLAFQLSASATGTPAPTFAWKRNGVIIPGATSSTLSIASAQPQDAGEYVCIATNLCGSATSSLATITVLSPVTITASPGSTTTCAGSTATFSVTASGTPPLSYQWRRNGSPVSGQTGAVLQLTASSNTAGSYDCIVTNTCGSSTSSAATLTVETGPAFTLSPIATSACLGQPASFTVFATGAQPITYQWRRNGVAIAGATNATLTLGTTQLSDAASYDCVATNRCTVATSSPATLIVYPAVQITQQPRPVPLILGTNAVFSVTVTGGEAPTFQWRKAGSPLTNGGRVSGAMSSQLTITSIVAGDESSYDCVVTDRCGTVTSQAAPLTCRPVFTLQPVGGDYAARTTVQLSASVAASGTVTYRWRKDGANLFNSPIYTGVSTPTLTINSTDPSQSGDYVLSATKSCGTTLSDIATVTFSCLADFNLDGGVDGTDVEEFFLAWEQGDSMADTNQDGGIDGSDVEVFFAAWESGC